MANFSDLNPLFSGAYSIRFRPILNSLHLDVPELDSTDFSHINSILKTAADSAQLKLTLSFKNEKYVNLILYSKTESITIERLRPMYSLKRKLIQNNPDQVELCLYNYQIPGMYIGTKFKLELEA